MKTKTFGGYGRHTVRHSSGRVFHVEPIIPHENYRTVWGDVDPASNRVTGNYNGKERGGVTEKESVITEANGYKNIHLVKGSPYSAIDKIVEETS